MADAESIAPGAVRPFTRSSDWFHVIGGGGTPLVLLNAEAPPQALAALAAARLALLDGWVTMLTTCDSQLDYEPKELALMLLPMVEDARQIVDTLKDRLTALERAKHAVEAAQA